MKINRWDIECFVDRAVDLYNAGYMSMKDLQQISSIAITIKAQIVLNEAKEREEEKLEEQAKAEEGK